MPSTRGIEAALEEIELDAFQGCSLTRLWKLLADRVGVETSSANSPDEDQEDSSMIEQEASHGLSAETKEELWKALLRETRRVRVAASAQEAADQRWIPSSSLVSLTMEQALDRYGSGIRFVALQEGWQRAVFGEKVKPGEIQGESLRVLIAAARARSQGVPQSELARTLGIDNRSLYHFVKRLIEKGLVVKFPVLHKAAYTNCVQHFRFFRPSNEIIEIDLTADRIDLSGGKEGALVRDFHAFRKFLVDVLDRAANKTLALLDLKYLFSKENRRRVGLMLAKLQQDGYVERVDVREGGDSNHGVTACVRMLKPYEIPKVDLIDKEKHEETVVERKSAENAQKHILLDLPLDYQVYSIVERAGAVGITTVDIVTQLGGLEKKMVEKVMNTLLQNPNKDFAIRKTAEFVGRQRHNRYFLCRPPRFPYPFQTRDSDMQSSSQTPSFAPAQQPFTMISTPLPTAPESAYQLVSSRDTITAAKRRESLLIFLREMLIVDISARTASLFQERFCGNDPNAPKLDKKTLKRDAETLRDLGRIKMIEFQIPRVASESFESRTLIHLVEVPFTEELKRAFLESLCERAVKPMAPAPKRNLIEDVSLERISTSVEAVEEQKSPKQDPNSESYWYTVALDYGWISGRLARTKLLHHFIWAYVRNKQHQTGKEDDWTFPFSALYRELPLSLYLKIIGHTERTPCLTEYLASQQNTDLSLTQLPAKVAGEIYSDIPRFRRVLRLSLDFLVTLDLLHPVAESNDQPFVSEYEVLHLAKLYDFSSGDKQLVSQFSLKEENALQMYWNQLKSIHMEDSKQRSEKTVEGPFGQLLITLAHSGNWIKDFHFDQHQREYLRSFIREEKETPLEDHRQLVEIANHVDAPIARVRQFYRRFLQSKGLPIPKLVVNKKTKKKGATVDDHEEDAFGVPLIHPMPKLSLHELRQAKLAQGATTIPEYRSLRLLKKVPENFLHSKEEKMRQALEAEEDYLAFVRSQKERAETEVKEATPEKKKGKKRAKALSEEKEEEAEEASLGPTQKRQRVRKAAWTEAEDRVLCASYVVVNECSEIKNRFFWIYASNVLPHRESVECRRRFGAINERPATSSHLTILREMWPKVREDAIASNCLQPVHSEEDDFDVILEHIRYLANWNDVPVASQTFECLLPETVEEMSRFDIRELEHLAVEELHQAADHATSLRQQLELKCAQPFAIPLRSRTEMQLNSPEDPNQSKIYSTIRNIVLSPSEDFERQEATAFFEQFPAEQVEALLQQAKQDSLVSDNKSMERRTQGRSFVLSRKAAALLENGLPGAILEEALDTAHALASSKEECRRALTTLPDGKVLALLDQMVYDALELAPDSLQCCKDTRLRQKCLDDPKVSLQVEASSTDNPPLSQKPVRGNRFVSHDPPTPPTSPEKLSSAAQMIFSMVEEHGEMGVVLKEFFNETRALALPAAMATGALRDLLVSKKVLLVGSKAHRLVSDSFASVWLRSLSMADSTDMPEDVASIRTQTSPASVWYSFRGDFLPVLFQKCANALMLAVFQKPALSKTALHKKFELVMNPCEMDQVLFFLVSQGALLEDSSTGESTCSPVYTVGPQFYLRGQLPSDFDPLQMVADFATQCFGMSQQISS